MIWLLFFLKLEKCAKQEASFFSGNHIFLNTPYSLADLKMIANVLDANSEVLFYNNI